MKPGEITAERFETVPGRIAEIFERIRLMDGDELMIGTFLNIGGQLA